MYCLSSRVTYVPHTVETRHERSVHLGVFVLPILDFQKSPSSDFICDFVARGRPLRGQKRLAPLAKRSTCSKSIPIRENFLCQVRVSAAMLLVETGEKGKGRGAIVDVAWYVNSPNFSLEFLA